MESANFMQWFEKLFLPAVKHRKTRTPVMLIFDGEGAKENNARLLHLTPHSTHLLQPRDFLGFIARLWK